MHRLLAATALAVVIATPALADCAGSKAIDRCLVGTWNYKSGGGEQWINRNIRSVHVDGMTHNGLTMTLRPDGAFVSGKIDATANVRMKSGKMAGTGHATGQASGTWSAANGRLMLCMAPGGLTTKVTVMVHGKPITVTPPMNIRPQAMTYTCNATTLTTTVPIARREPVVTVYSRGR